MYHVLKLSKQATLGETFVYDILSLGILFDMDLFNGSNLLVQEYGIKSFNTKVPELLAIYCTQQDQ